jgi:hypothetical protein
VRVRYERAQGDVFTLCTVGCLLCVLRNMGTLCECKELGKLLAKLWRTYTYQVVRGACRVGEGSCDNEIN